MAPNHMKETILPVLPSKIYSLALFSCRAGEEKIPQEANPNPRQGSRGGWGALLCWKLQGSSCLKGISPWGPGEGQG